MHRIVLSLLTVLLLLSACASKQSPLATNARDLKSLAGVWEEEWPGQQEKDRYRIEIVNDRVRITPLTRQEKQRVRDVYFQHKRLTFILDLDGSPVYYDLVLADEGVLAGRVKGGKENYDEPVHWYRVE